MVTSPKLKTVRIAQNIWYSHLDSRLEQPSLLYQVSTFTLTMQTTENVSTIKLKKKMEEKSSKKIRPSCKAHFWFVGQYSLWSFTATIWATVIFNSKHFSLFLELLWKLLMKKENSRVLSFPLQRTIKNWLRVTHVRYAFQRRISRKSAFLIFQHVCLKFIIANTITCIFGRASSFGTCLHGS